MCNLVLNIRIQIGKLAFHQRHERNCLSVCIYRVTTSTRLGLYDLLYAMYGPGGYGYHVDLARYNASDVSVGDLFTLAGHRAEDMIMG